MTCKLMVTLSDKRWILTFQVEESELHLVEGGDDKTDLHISFNFPPSMFCMYDEDDCHIRISLTVNNTQDLMCDGKVVPQIVLKQEDSMMDTCSISFTVDNWKDEIKLPVYAVMDSLKDGKQTAMIHIESQAMSNNKTQSEAILNMEDIKVTNTFNLLTVLIIINNLFK